MTIDLDSTGAVRRPQAGRRLRPRKLGYHPLLASRADTGEVLHARQRTGRANTARGAAASSTNWPRECAALGRPGS